MIYLLYGDDDFTIGETLAGLKEGVGPEDLRDVNISELDGANVTLDLLKATAGSVPFLAEKRLVIVRGLLSKFERRGRGQSGESARPSADEWAALDQSLPLLPPTTDLVFVDGKLVPSNPLLKVVRPHAEVRTFSLPRPNELRDWIRRRAGSLAIQIEPRAVDTLAETIGNDLRVVSNELEKLALYRSGETVRHEDVEEMVSYTGDANIFAAVDAMLEGRPGVAIRLVHKLLTAGSPAQYLLVMMARQVRLLLLAKEIKAAQVPAAEHGTRLGLSGYPLRKTMQQESRFSHDRLVEIHGKLLEADLATKTLPVDEEVILDTLIADVASTPSATSR